MKKKVALVLSSGGPRGFAYIGAIDELLDRGYEITSVAGTSIGSLIGGMYAAGRLPEVKKWLFSLDTWKIFTLMDLSISRNHLVNGDRVINALMEIVPDINIEDLEIPYKAIATDFYTGEEVVFDRGDMFHAIRASISIPSLFRPVKYAGRTLIDGGIANTMPMDRVDRTEGDIMVAINVNDVDVDRYMVNGEYTQTFLSAREIDEEKISQTWLNKHLKYTHGYGVTLSRVDEITASGQPEMLIKNIPPTSQVEEISIDRPEIYFGEMTNEYAIVGTNEDEFDYPDGDENKYTQYEGTAGIKLNLINRLMFTIKEKNPKILVSSNIDGDSKIIINRNISDRVQKIMPYLQYDKDPYIVTEGGKLYWIIDAYTTSTQFPYSEPYDVDNTKTNYVRNSVKVIIDAYNGTVDYYVVDKEDPIAATFSKIYPELFKDGDDMPEGLKAHMRYPNQLFDTQAKVYSRYHMEDVRVFYQNEDQWDIAKETYGTEEKEMEPNYYIMNLPGESEAEFVNSVPFTPKDKKNMAGLMVARNDGDNYGELILYQLPKNKVVYGPQQVEAQIDQDPEISKEFSLWNSSGSKYSRGNMFVIPIEESLLYVEPVYLEASESSIPEVKRVIVVYGDRIAYEPTLAEALNSLFGDGTIEERDSSSGSSSDSKDSSSGEKASMTELIQSANDAFDNAVKAQESGDWAKYGEYLDELEGYLKELEK